MHTTKRAVSAVASAVTATEPVVTKRPPTVAATVFVKITRLRTVTLADGVNSTWPSCGVLPDSCTMFCRALTPAGRAKPFRTAASRPPWAGQRRGRQPRGAIGWNSKGPVKVGFADDGEYGTTYTKPGTTQVLIVAEDGRVVTYHP